MHIFTCMYIKYLISERVAATGSCSTQSPATKPMVRAARSSDVRAYINLRSSNTKRHGGHGRVIHSWGGQKYAASTVHTPFIRGK